MKATAHRITPEIAWEWDGETPTAKLLVNGLAAEGAPKVIEEIFHRLAAEQNRVAWLESRLSRIAESVDRLGRLACDR